MERLTFDGNFCDIARCMDSRCKVEGTCTQKEVWKRLKAYEDTGWTPEMIGYIKDQDLLDLLDEYGRSILTAAKINRLERVYFPAELHVGDRAWKKAMSILDKKYAEAKKMPFVRDPLAWALYHTWREFDDGKRCD